LKHNRNPVALSKWISLLTTEPGWGAHSKNAAQKLGIRKIITQEIYQMLAVCLYAKQESLYSKWKIFEDGEDR